MQFLNYILLQLDEACRHIRDGRLAQLRIALLLLDNAAEIQMANCARQNLQHEEIREHIRTLGLSVPEGERGEHLQEIVDWQPLSHNKKCAIDRNYADKLKYLSERTKQLDSCYTLPLSHLHKYRNEAYHHAKVRKETIETATRLLLDINCELLLSLTRGWASYGSGDDCSWLEERFGVDRITIMSQCEDFIHRVIHEFRASAQLDNQTVITLLADHLDSRIQDTLNVLVVIVASTNCPDLESAIRDSFGINMARRKREGLSMQFLSGTESRHSVTWLQSLRERQREVTRAQDKLQAFERFSILESEFEPVEESVNERAMEIDRAIQMAVDIARGK